MSSNYYKSWGNAAGVIFDEWWRDHSYLFEQRSVRLVSSIDVVDLNTIFIEVPLNESPTDLTKKVKKIIEEEHAKIRSDGWKNKTVLTTNFTITAGSEPKLDTIRDMLYVYRDVVLKGEGLKGKKLYDAVLAYYQSKPKRNQIPYSLIANSRAGSLDNAMRNLRRWIQRAEKITLNVADGVFPGVYD